MPATIAFTRPLTGEQYHNALSRLKRKLVLEVARDNLEHGYGMAPSPTLDALGAGFDNDENNNAVMTGMLDEIEHMLDEIERELDDILTAGAALEQNIERAAKRMRPA